MLTDRDHYAVLGLTRTASPDEVRGAYRKAARATHPDLHPDDATALDRFKRVQLAYEVLGDPHRRAAYDAPLYDVSGHDMTASAQQGTAARSAAGSRSPRRQPEPPISLARELGETVRAIRVVARRSGFSRRVNRLFRYLERL
jgi:curved DNA-binding protein CbpA